METKDAISALAAIAHESRLAVFRLLVQAGPAGLPAGRIADTLGIPPSSLSFHLKELSHAGMAIPQPAGRSIIYSANFARMNQLLGYLTENCCGGNPCSKPDSGSVADHCQHPVSFTENFSEPDA